MDLRPVFYMTWFLYNYNSISISICNQCPGARRSWMLGCAETNTMEQVDRFSPSPPLHGNRVDQEYNLPCADEE